MSNNKGIPTIGVRGIQFRSRIEAQWAYIFEKLGWNWEYEPIDLDGYIPDFIVKFGDEDFLIEIKGDTNIWKEEVYKPHKEKIIKSGWNKSFIILGATFDIKYDGINIGVLFEPDNQIQYDMVRVNLNTHSNKLVIGTDKHPDFLYLSDLLYCQEFKHYQKCCETKTFTEEDKERSMKMFDNFHKPLWSANKNEREVKWNKIWIEAKNSVQWKGHQNKNKFKPNMTTLNKILKNSTQNENGESYIKYNGSKYEGLSYEESKYFIERGGISKFIDDIFNVEYSNLKTIKEVLLHPLISDTDKKRIIRCYEKVKLHFDIHNELPIWGNTDIFIDNKAYIYKIYYDKTIQYIQTNDMSRYKKITFDDVPQSPIKMNKNDFMN
jgi:hypothetical protein